MKIAVHVDAVGHPVSLYEDGIIHLYEGSGDCWSKIGAFPFVLPAGASIPEVRGLVERAAARLDDCRTLISGDRHGYVYALLGQDLGFDCWTSDGAVADQLALVERRRDELAAERTAAACAPSACASGSCGSGRSRSSCAPSPTGPAAEAPPPEDLGDGRLRIDLAALLGDRPGLNSRSVLYPALEARAFAALEIVCDHLPRWFAAKLDALGLDATEERRADGRLVVTVTDPGV